MTNEELVIFISGCHPSFASVILSTAKDPGLFPYVVIKKLPQPIGWGTRENLLSVCSIT